MSVRNIFNSLRPRQNGRHFPDDILKCILLNENIWILIEISLKFVPKGPINNIPALVQIMAWRQPGDKPLSELMMDYRCIYASLGCNELTFLVLKLIFQDSKVSSMAIDALAHCITRSSATMLLTVQKKWICVSHVEGFWLSVSSQSWELRKGKYRWLSARRQYRHCICNGNTAVLH